MRPSFRVLPLGGPDALATAWFEGERELLQVATSVVGIGIDLTTDLSKITAAESELRRLHAALEEFGSIHAASLGRYLAPVVRLQLRTKSFDLAGPVIMGILNLTEDSFSGDGVGENVGAALARAESLRAAGADIIDVGAESARADRPVLDSDQEAALVRPAIDALVREGHAVSIDSYKPEVATAALESGAELVNDISGLTLGTGAAEAAADANAAYILNYSYSVPKRRPETPPAYTDVVAETVGWFEQRLIELSALGLPRDSLVIDPGIAFGKSHDEDIQVIRRLGELRTFGQPILLAHSRKNFIGSINGQPPAERDLETHMASALAYAKGARLFRVHDPAGARRALDVAAAIESARPGAFAPDETSWPWRAGASATHMTREAPASTPPPGQRW